MQTRWACTNGQSAAQLRWIMKACKPVALLAPRLFVADHIDDFALDPGLDLAGRVQGNQDVTAALDPNGVPEAICKLNYSRLLIGQKAAVQVVALGFGNSGNCLVPFQLVRRSHRLLGGSADITFRATHFADAQHDLWISLCVRACVRAYVWICLDVWGCVCICVENWVCGKTLNLVKR